MLFFLKSSPLFEEVHVRGNHWGVFGPNVFFPPDPVLGYFEAPPVSFRSLLFDVVVVVGRVKVGMVWVVYSIGMCGDWAGEGALGGCAPCNGGLRCLQ